MATHLTYPELTAQCCWVYILRPENGKPSICYCLDLPAHISSIPLDTHLLFYRNFSVVHEAIAYKLYLEHISVETLDTLIAADNPRRRDLRKRLQQGKRTCEMKLCENSYNNQQNTNNSNS